MYHIKKKKKDCAILNESFKQINCNFYRRKKIMSLYSNERSKHTIVTTFYNIKNRIKKTYLAIPNIIIVRLIVLTLPL